MTLIPFKHKKLNFPEGHVYVASTDTKHAETCILVHGFLGHHHWWHWLIPKLVAHYNVVVMDLPGMGQSDDRDSYSLHDMGASIATIALACQDKKIHLVGHSLGALASAHALLQSPELFASFICIDMDLMQLQTSSKPSQTSIPRRFYPEKEGLLSRFRLVPPETLLSQNGISYLAHKSISLFDSGWAWSFDPKIFNINKTNIFKKFCECCQDSTTNTHLILGDKTSVLNIETAKTNWQVLTGNNHVVVMPGFHHLMLDEPSLLADLIHQAVQI
jgi:pimeloyl-ACP methyl ester carboxylesterase